VERLGRGWRLYSDGEYAAARRVLGGLDRLHNRDYALYLLAQAELLSGEPAAALGHFQKLAALGSRFQTLARWRAADALYAAGRLAEAKQAYEALLGRPSDEVEPAVAKYHIAEALERSSPAAAAAAYRRVYLEEPLHPLAERALARLQALEPGATIPPAGRVARARILTANRAWARALDELALVPSDALPAVRHEADYWIGMTHFKMRHGYDVAADKLLGVWRELPTDELREDALFHGARAWSRVDKDDEAIAGYRQVVARGGKHAPEASFLIGWLEFNRGRYAAAVAGLEETRKRFSRQYGDEARWYAGFSRWLLGDVKGALADFEALAASPGALTGGKGAYWRGRALDQLGRADEAKAVWRALVADHPFSYYALQARVRLRERGVTLGPFAGPRGSAPPLSPFDPALTEDELILRVDELTAAGLTVEAGVELRRGEADLVKRFGAARALPVLFDRYLRGEDFHRPHQLAESYAGAALRLDPHADPQARAWWTEVYPRAYREYIEKYSPSGENPPYYLYTIMQKESAYNPHDTSYADAIGLLQMIPPTSRRVAERIDYPYTDDILYDPEGNIRFGAWYIGHLLKKFKGQIALGAGSYNAGPHAMMKWILKNGRRPLDEFVELCPYTQTREYMKKALDIYARYVYLYEKEDYLPDARVDAGYLDDGIDY
jgi:soluble lytic murein transglycosylase